LMCCGQSVPYAVRTRADKGRLSSPFLCRQARTFG